MWDMMQKASKDSKIGAEFFTKFLHWLYVKMMSKKIERMKSLDDISMLFGISRHSSKSMPTTKRMCTSRCAISRPH